MRVARTAFGPRTRAVLVVASALLGIAGCAALEAVNAAASTTGAVVGGAARATHGVANRTVDALGAASAASSAR